jgi:hypothetical protein
MSRTVLAAALTLVTATVVIARDLTQGGVPSGTVSGTYQDFMKLPADERPALFAAITPESKAVIMRTHIERWIHSNKERLTTSEIAVFEEIAAWVTPQIYRKGTERALDQREQALRARMRCGVSPEDVRAATNLYAPASIPLSEKATWSYLDQAKCWIEWFLEGVIDYVPR